MFDSPAGFSQDRPGRFKLSLADLQDQAPAGLEKSGCFRGETPDHVQPVGTAAEREGRVEVADFGHEAGHLVVGDVGRITDDGVEAFEQAGLAVRGDEIAFEQANAFGETVCGEVFGGQGEGLGGNVRRDDVRGGQFPGQRDGNAPRSRSDVGDGGIGRVTQQIERGLHHALRLGPRHKGAPVAPDRERPELRRAKEVLNRFARRAAADELAEPIHRLRGKRLLKARVEVNPFTLERMGEQSLGGEAGGVNAL